MERDKGCWDVFDMGHAFIIGIVLSGIIGSEIFFNAGVKAHAEGKYTIVLLPNGNEIVCNVVKDSQ